MGYGLWVMGYGIWGIGYGNAAFRNLNCSSRTEFGIYGIWLGMFADWWISGILYFHRMISMKWSAN